jgi:molybdopterin-containing oxidoreductase family membrane subunit
MPEQMLHPAPTLPRFVLSSIGHLFRGPLVYWLWVLFLVALIALGGWHYWLQLRDGLVVTNMTNQVSWGFYIANFTFLVGVAAAAVMLVVPAYIFHRRDIKDVVLMGDTMAIAAVTMAILFVVVDLGRPDRFWHLLPGIGRFNFPESMLAWDVIVLNGYLLLNLGISFYIVYNHYRDREPKASSYFPWVLLAIFWAISIHTVTAFLYSANTGRPYWHNALLAPRFIASAFASGPALMAIGLQIIRAISDYPIRQSVINHLALVAAIALQVTLFFLLAELFTEFYHEGEHAASARYLFFGLDGHNGLTPWIWSAVALLTVAVMILMIHPLRRNPVTMNIAFVLIIVGVWIEKGMGLIIPAFVPTPIGEIYEYVPSLTEIMVSIGIWAIGLLLFTLLAKAALPVQCEFLRRQRAREQNNWDGVERRHNRE